MSSVEKAIEKARALLRLAAGTSSAAEAAAAAGQAEVILGRHRLTMADLARKNDVDMVEDDVWHATRARSWVEHLASGLAHHYGCFASAAVSARSVTLRVAGSPEDVAICRAMFSELHAIVAGLSLTEKGGRSRRSFAEGAVAAILRSLHRAAQAAAVERRSSALVLASRAGRSEAWVRGRTAVARKRPSQAEVDHAARTRGYEAGKAVHLGGRLASGAERSPRGSGGGR